MAHSVQRSTGPWSCILGIGAAIGSLIGAGVGAAVGIIQGASMHRERPVPPNASEQVTLRFTVTSSPDSAMLMPALNGSF